MSRKADHYKSEVFGVYSSRDETVINSMKFAAASSSKHISMMSNFIDRPSSPTVLWEVIWRSSQTFPPLATSPWPHGGRTTICTRP